MIRRGRPGGSDSSVRLVHTSDLHLFAARGFDEDLAMARSLAATVVSLGADVVAIAGDLFDHNRVEAAAAADLLAVLAEPGRPVVVLPGNHDPLTADSVYRRVARPPNVLVLGLDGPELHLQAGLAIAGRAHVDYRDFPPLDLSGPDHAGSDQPGPGGGGLRVVLGHGHYDLAGEADAALRPGWLITAADLERLSAAYVALGHWDRAFEVRPSNPPTYYSGSPWLARSVNVVDLGPGGRVAVRRAGLHDPVPSA